MTADGRPSPVFEAGSLGPLTLKNRIIKSATFEGATPKGVVGDDLVSFHRAVAEGGAAMSTVAYLAVSPEGRTDRHCVLLRDEARAGLKKVTDAIHRAGALASAQIGHAGPVANARSNGAPSLAPSRRLLPTGTMAHAVDDHDIARILTDYRRSAKVAVEAGFDAIEIHLGHNYLLSAFLSPKLNRRDDQWGGSLEARARFPREVVETVRQVTGHPVPVRESPRRAGDPAVLVAASAKANAELGWKAERNLEQMVSDAWAFYQSQG